MMSNMKEKLSLYVHIPFCVRKCRYCDFLSWPAEEEEQERYTAGLVCEIRSLEAAAGRFLVDTLFIGGGTPSLLSEACMEKILEQLHRTFEFEAGAECTVEANPGTLTVSKLSAYRRMGISRLSLGLQSASDRELALLGRIHTWQDFLNQFRTARQNGWNNINVDLMSGIPGQTADSWRETLESVCDLHPEHISAYSLILEPGTELWRLYGDGEGSSGDTRRNDRGCIGELPPLPDEETERSMYRMTRNILSSHGYKQYEISNYCLDDFSCRHNIGYWTGKSYLGLGVGASSYLDGVRFQNPAAIDDYRKACRADRSLIPPDGRESQTGYIVTEICDRKAHMEEFMFLGLRMTEGVSEQSFQDTFGQNIHDVYGPVISRFVSYGMMQQSGGRISLTERGIDVSNQILAEFLLN